MRASLLGSGILLASMGWGVGAWAQYPPQPPYPQPPYPQQGPAPEYGPAPLPPPQQQAPAWPPPPQQPYAPPPQPYVPPQYPPPQQPYAPAPYPQPLPAPYPQPMPVVQPPVPPPSRFRSPGEMVYLYGTSLAYGIGTGVWIDALAKEDDPGIAFIAPLVFGAAVPIGMYIWDANAQFDRGVPSTMATGMLLGGVEGIAISGLQWQLSGEGSTNSSFRTWTSITFATATAGGAGGYLFGEWLRPDPRSLALISSGAAWGTISGIFLGSGVASDDHWKDGAAIAGFTGYNVGILATGVTSIFYVPSWQAIKYMWLGDLVGTAATTPVYLFYIGNWSQARHGLIAQSVGGLAGLGLAAALTANMTDGPGTASWSPPFQLTVSPMTGGGMVNAYGLW